MKTFDVSTEKAMDILGIPAEERLIFLEKLSQE